MCTALFMTSLLQRRNGATSTKQALPLPSPCARRSTRLRARFNPVGPEVLAHSDMRFLNHFSVQWRGHNCQRIFPLATRAIVPDKRDQCGLKEGVFSEGDRVITRVSMHTPMWPHHTHSFGAPLSSACNNPPIHTTYQL